MSKVRKANLILDKLRLKLTLPFRGHFISFYDLHFRFKLKTIYKGNNVNIKCLIVF